MKYELEKRISTDGQSWGPDCTLIHSSVIEKVAQECHTPESLVKAMEGLKPRPEGVYVLLNALGAYEYWSSNKNGDAFPEWSLKSMAPPSDVTECISKWNTSHPEFCITPPSTAQYGTQTFVTDAKVYQLHANKDPLKSIGDVIAAAYNDYMHRTELIVFIYEARDPMTVAAIRGGEPVPFSMGAKLPFDVCSICFNIAKNRGQYCEHLKFMLNKIMPDGRKVFSYNWFPKFFDISKVRVPADRSAWSLKKVAAYNSQVYDLSILPPHRIVPENYLFKTSSTRKLGAMIKEVPPEEAGKPLGSAPINPELLGFVRNQVASDCGCSRNMNDPQFDMAAKKHGLRDTLSAMSLGGILAKPDELMRLMHMTGEDIPESLALNNPPAKLITVIRAHMPARSLTDPHFAERRKIALASANEPLSEVPHLRDDRYQRYLDLLHREMPSIVKVACSPRIRVALEPSWIASSLFKTASSADPAMAWLPFMVAVTKSRFV